MKIRLSVMLAVLTAARVIAADTDIEEGKAVLSRITDVTVYADRAQVTRTAPVELPAGTSRLMFSKLPGWIDEGSIRVSLSPAGAGQILDVQIQRTYLAHASDEDFLKAEASVREIADQIAALDDEKSVLEAQTKQVEAIRLFSLDKLPKDVAVREIKVGEYDQSVEFIASSLRKIAAARRELDKKRRDLQPEMDARQKTQNELRQRAQLEQRTLIVTVKTESNRQGTMNLSYLLPGATWEPTHELRAVLDGKTVALASYANVTQSTGEDWSGVNLSLSTQRSTATMKIPELDAFLVGSGRKLPRFASSSGRDTFVDANRSWEMQNTAYFGLLNGGKDLGDYRANQSAQMARARRVLQIFETLQQRGTTTHFPAAAAQIIRSDARTVRVPIGNAELTAQYRIATAPEASLNAARIVDLVNSGKLALLPGPVALFVDGAFLGMTESEFVAPGESFALFLGVEDQIKLSRTLDKKKSELTRGGTKTKMKVSFLVTVENLSAREATVQLTDRVPVSESDDIRVSAVKIQPDGKPDAKGMLRWEFSLSPKQSREYRIEYTLEYPSEMAVYAEAEKRAKMEPASAVEDAAKKKSVSDLMPKAAAPADIRKQIESLERRF